MYYCPEIKQQLKSRLEDFEYACTATRSGERVTFDVYVNYFGGSGWRGSEWEKCQMFGFEN